MKGIKPISSHFQQRSLCLLSIGIGSIVALLFLLSPLAAFSQTPALKSSWSQVLTKALFALHDVQQRQERLLTYTGALQDSASLGSALAQLKEKGLSESAMVQKTDSLRQAFSAIKNKLEQLQTQEQILLNQIQGLQQKLPVELLPPEARKLLGQIKPVQNILPIDILPLTGLATPAALPRLQVLQLNKIALAANISSQVKQVTEGSIDFFAGREKELSEARRQLRKYSSRMDEIKSLKDLEKGYFWLNPLKGKPWPERVIVGTLWQFSNQEKYHIDLGPNLAWRLTDLFSLGVGFQYRLSASTKSKRWVNSADKVYGFNFLFDGQIKKGFFGRLQYENLNTLSPRSNQAMQFEQVEQEWIKGLSVGIGKTYKFYKKINGYGLVQYNLLYRHNETPYLRPVQAKIGFFINGGALFRQKQKQEKKVGSSNATR